jgi:MFS transporter, putative metabolite:H+ symporter
MGRIPITSYHRKLTWLLGFLFFFDLADINTLSFAAPAIMKSWHLPLSTIGYLTSSTFIGMCFGATLGGYFSDRFGRKKSLLLTTFWYACFSLLNACAWEPAGLFFTRMFTGVGIAAMNVVGITYICEMFPAKIRGAYQGWIMAIGLCGIPATAYVARFCVMWAPWGWRLVFVWGALGVLFAYLARSVDESPLWHESQGRLGEADAILDRIETRISAETALPPILEIMPVTVPSGNRYTELFSKNYRLRTALIIFAWTCFTLGFYGFTLWVPTLLVAHGFSLVKSLTWSSAMSLAAVPGALLAGLVSDRWDRKWLVAIVALLIAVSGILYGTTFKIATIVLFGAFVEIFTHTFTPLLYSYTAEHFPTQVRNSATGLAYGIARLVNVFGPLVIVAIYSHFGYTSVFLYIALCWLFLAAAVGLWGPGIHEHPRGRPL